MTTPQVIEYGIERRAAQMFEEDSRNLTLVIPWNVLDEHLRESYRASARIELAMTKRIEVTR